jgi:hypothetical protein
MPQATQNGGPARVLPDLPVTRCDAVDRGCPMPAAESGRRDWPGPGGRRQAEVALEMRAGVRPPVARSCLARRARNTAAWASLGCRPLCAVQAVPATEAGTFGVAGAKAVAGKGVSCVACTDGIVALVAGPRVECAATDPPRRRGRGRGAGGAAPGQPGTVAVRIGDQSGTVLEYGITGEQPAAWTQSPRHLSLGRRHRERLEPDHRTASSPLTSRKCPNDQG